MWMKISNTRHTGTLSTLSQSFQKPINVQLLFKWSCDQISNTTEEIPSGLSTSMQNHGNWCTPSFHNRLFHLSLWKSQANVHSKENMVWHMKQKLLLKMVHWCTIYILAMKLFPLWYVPLCLKVTAVYLIPLIFNACACAHFPCIVHHEIQYITSSKKSLGNNIQTVSVY